MEWLNYHHLRYFYVAAKEGSLKKAAEKLRVSQPSISAQVKELEAALGEPLFRRSGRCNVLTDAGQVALRYAEEIYSLGNEMVNAIKQRPGARAVRLYVGVADSFPKLVTNEILKPAMHMGQTVHIICREGKIDDLLAQLAAHRLDLVLADEPAAGNLRVHVFNHLLGDTGVTFCGTVDLAKKLTKNFPQSLHDAPALMPAETTALRRSLEKWFQGLEIRPRIIAEFEDAALMKVMAADGQGFIPVPTLVVKEAIQRYGLRKIGATEACRDQFYAITAERRISHPAVIEITRAAQKNLPTPS